MPASPGTAVPRRRAPRPHPTVGSGAPGRKETRAHQQRDDEIHARLPVSEPDNAQEPTRPGGRHPERRATAGLLPADGADPAVRGTCRPGLHGGEDRRLLPSEPGRGGDRRRPDGRSGRDGLPLHQLSGARLRDRARHRPRAGDGRTVRPDRRCLARLGRIHAHVRHRDPVHGRIRHRRWSGAARHRGGAGDRLPRRQRSRHVSHGRRHHQHRRVPRIAEHRRAVGPADRLRDRQQRPGHGHDRRTVLGRTRVVQTSRRLPHGLGPGGRQRPGRGAPGGPGRAGRSPARKALPAGDRVRASERPLGGGPREVPQQGGSTGAEGRGPHRPVRGPAERGRAADRRAHRRDRHRGHRGGRSSRRIRRRQPAPGGLDAVRLHLRHPGAERRAPAPGDALFPAAPRPTVPHPGV